MSELMQEIALLAYVASLKSVRLNRGSSIVAHAWIEIFSILPNLNPKHLIAEA